MQENYGYFTKKIRAVCDRSLRIIYVMGTCSHKATDRLQVRSTNIYNKVHSAVEIYDFGDGVWFL